MQQFPTDRWSKWDKIAETNRSETWPKRQLRGFRFTPQQRGRKNKCEAMGSACTWEHCSLTCQANTVYGATSQPTLPLPDVGHRERQAGRGPSGLAEQKRCLCVCPCPSCLLLAQRDECGVSCFRPGAEAVHLLDRIQVSKEMFLNSALCFPCLNDLFRVYFYK